MGTNPWDWRSWYDLQGLQPAPADSTPPPLDSNWQAATAQQRVAQALLNRSTAPGSAEGAPSNGRFRTAASPLQPLTQVAGVYLANDLARQADETKQALRLGMKPNTYPAYGDDGALLPRAPGMVQPDPWTTLSKWWNNLGS